MAEVSIPIGGFSYQVACRDGEEAHLVRLGQLVDSKAGEARAAVGNVGEVRQLLLAALLLADESTTSASITSATPEQSSPRGDLLIALAERLEAVADRVEMLVTSP